MQRKSRRDACYCEEGVCPGSSWSAVQRLHMRWRHFSLKKEKSADSKGIKAEDIKGAEEETTKMIHEIFKLIIKENSIAPSSWKRL